MVAREDCFVLSSILSGGRQWAGGQVAERVGVGKKEQEG